MKEWISVTERLPKKLQDTIVAAYDPECRDNCMVDLGFWHPKKGWRLTGFADLRLDVRYWQPLPEPITIEEETTKSQEPK